MQSLNSVKLEQLRSSGSNTVQVYPLSFYEHFAVQNDWKISWTFNSLKGRQTTIKQNVISCQTLANYCLNQSFTSVHFVKASFQ